MLGWAEADTVCPIVEEHGSKYQRPPSKSGICSPRAAALVKGNLVHSNTL
jgi:hypothetical protein